MPFHLGVPELLIVLFILLLLFGAGRITGIARDLGRGVRELRKGFSEDDRKPEATQTDKDVGGQKV